MIWREARRGGTPAAMDYAIFAAMWLVPQNTRRKVRDLLVPQGLPA